SGVLNVIAHGESRPARGAPQSGSTLVGAPGSDVVEVPGACHPTSSAVLSFRRNHIGVAAVRRLEKPAPEVVFQMSAGREFRWRGGGLIAPEPRPRPLQKRGHPGGPALGRPWVD